MTSSCRLVLAVARVTVTEVAPAQQYGSLAHPLNCETISENFFALLRCVRLPIILRDSFLCLSSVRDSPMSVFRSLLRQKENSEEEEEKMMENPTSRGLGR